MFGEVVPIVRVVLSAVIVGLIVIDTIALTAFAVSSVGRLFADLWFPDRHGPRRSRLRTAAKFLIDVVLFSIFTGLMIALVAFLAFVAEGVSILESTLNVFRSVLSYIGSFMGSYLPQFIVIVGVVLASLLFRLKSRHKIKYGLLEVIFAVGTMISVAGAMSATGLVSPANIAFSGAVYVFIRGLTNIYEGLSDNARKQFDTWFLGRPTE